MTDVKHVPTRSGQTISHWDGEQLHTAKFPASDVDAIVAGLSEGERAVIIALFPYAGGDAPYFNAKHLADVVGLGWPKEQAAEVARSLRGKGLVDAGKGLWTEDGEMYGSGWCLNSLGLAVRAKLEANDG